jgi:hypothetical protein
MKKFFLSIAIAVLFAVNANASLVRLDQGSFTPAASVITFSESGYGLGTTNPVYTLGAYTVSFGGYFTGGLGTPTADQALSFAAGAPNTFITNDGANPTTPVLSGTPQFNGPIAVLFSHDVAAVGLNGGYFDAIGGTTIAAYGRSGNLLGTVTNSALGIEFFGLGDSTGNAVIAGIQFYITGNEPAGYAIDNLTFALDAGGYNPPGAVPEPASLILIGLGLLGLAGFRKRIS